MKPNLDRYSCPEGAAGVVVPEEAFDVTSVRNRVLDIRYGALPEQQLDLYYPEQGEGPFPLLLYIHGGGWRMGTRRICFLDCIIGAVEHGYAVASMDYRLVPGVCFPEFLYDVKTAVRWARANAAEYRLDSERIGAIGDSAGGTLALLLGFTAGMPGWGDEHYGWSGVSDAVQAVCAMYAPTVLDGDEEAWLRENGLRRRIVGDGKADVYGEAFGTADRETLRRVSPVSLVHPDIPPVLLQHGRADALVPCQHSIFLARRIETLCSPDRVQLRLYPERDHGDRLFLGEANCREVLTFFDRLLKPSGGKV